MIKNGLAFLQQHEEEVNRLNVFPVPDGDTGTNMALTLGNGIRYAKSDENAGAYLRSLSDGMLLGARGNSGVILSQFYRGFADVRSGGHLSERMTIPLCFAGAVCQQMLERLHAAAEAELVVERPARPDLAVVDLGGERRVRPVLAIGGHHVVVGHHHHGRQRRVAPGPAHEDAVLVDAREFERLERARVEALERGHPAVERLAIELGRVITRDGGDAQQRTEALDLLVAGVIAARVDGRAGRQRGLERRCANHTHYCQCKNYYQDENNSNHGASCNVGVLYRYLRISFSATCGNIGPTSQIPIKNRGRQTSSARGQPARLADQKTFRLELRRQTPTRVVSTLMYRHSQLVFCRHTSKKK